VSYYIALPLLLVLATAEAAVLPMFRIAGLQPNLVLVFLVAWLMVRGANEVYVLVPCAGLFLGFVDGAPLGTALLALAPLAILHDLRGARFREGEFFLTVIFTVVATFAYQLIYLLVYTLQGDAGSWPAAPIDVITRVTVPTTFLNVAVLLPIYMLIWLASYDQRRAAYA
jgi:rod shape-determining protein MreD